MDMDIFIATFFSYLSPLPEGPRKLDGRKNKTKQNKAKQLQQWYVY